jgi:hypothetical protein
LDYLALYSKNCKRCKHLDPDEKIAYDDCHYSKGNTQCPASEVQIVVVGAAERAALLLKQARAQGDLVREAKILKAVAKKSQAFQHKFKELVG